MYLRLCSSFSSVCTWNIPEKDFRCKNSSMDAFRSDKSAVNRTNLRRNQYLLWPPFAFKTAPVLSGTLVHTFLFQASWRVLQQFLCGFSLYLCLMSLHVIPDWLHDVETRALWRPGHLLQDSWFSLSRKIALWLCAWGHCDAAEGVWDQSDASLMVLGDG